MDNKNVNSRIGSIGGGVGALILFFPLLLFLQTGNFAFLGLFVLLFSVLLVVSFLLVNKYVKVKVVETPQPMNPSRK